MVTQGIAAKYVMRTKKQQISLLCIFEVKDFSFQNTCCVSAHFDWLMRSDASWKLHRYDGKWRYCAFSTGLMMQEVILEVGNFFDWCASWANEWAAMFGCGFLGEIQERKAYGRRKSVDAGLLASLKHLHWFWFAFIWSCTLQIYSYLKVLGSSVAGLQSFLLCRCTVGFLHN